MIKGLLGVGDGGVPDLVQLGIVSVPLWRVTRLAQPIDRRRVGVAERHPHRAHVLYGFGFILAGFG